MILRLQIRFFIFRWLTVVNFQEATLWDFAVGAYPIHGPLLIIRNSCYKSIMKEKQILLQSLASKPEGRGHPFVLIAVYVYFIFNRLKFYQMALELSRHKIVFIFCFFWSFYRILDVVHYIFWSILHFLGGYELIVDKL